MKENDNKNDPSRSARSLWGRLIHGGELSHDEQTALRGVLKSDERFREECDSDATVHALLSSMHDVRQSEDDFVQSVMRAVNQAGPEFTQAEVGTETEIANPQVVKVAAPYSTDRVGRRASAGWLAMTVTTVLFAATGLLVWWASDQRSTGNGNLQVNGPVAQVPLNPPQAAPVSEQPPKTEVASTQPNTSPVPAPIVEEKAADRTMADVTANDSTATDEITADEAKQKIALVGGTFVTLTKVEDPIWERSWVEGDRIGDDVVRLFGGRLELSFDDGAKVTLEGPIEFRPMTSGQLQLRRGRLMAAVPKEAIGFTVSTPTSQVVDLGTEFEVSVKETGASDVVVTKGEIEVMPAVAKGETPRKWRLVPSGLNQASFFERSGENATSPVSAAIRGTDGAFQGMISINGQAAEFTSAEAFDDVRERVMQQFEKSQQETLQQWTEFVASMQKNVQGTMQLNGAEVQFGNFEDVMKLQQQMLERMQIPGGDPANIPESNFSGSINVNGKVITFRTREEYEAARRKAFGAAANFGAGDFLDRRKSSTRRNNKGSRP